MIPKLRQQFNQEFSQSKYQNFISILEKESGILPKFRVSESPIFLSQEFKSKLEDASESIISQIKNLSPGELSKAVPKTQNVPNDTRQPHFFTIDFGICKNEKEEIIPQLIELQAFPSLYSFQKSLENAYIETYPFLAEYKSKITHNDYFEKLKNVILGKENPENVVLLEVYPEKQKTNIDFYLTEKYLGIKTLCLTKIIKKGRKLFYENNGEEIEIKRIYNRVIFDELDNIPDLKTEFKFTDEIDATWVTHPNWFFKISKYLLPKLEHEYVPRSYFLNDFPENENISEFVLKPLFSFAGAGVELNPTKEIIDKINNKENYIMQKKVSYASLFEDINGKFSKAEIRLLYIWNEDKDRPELINQLVRMTKAAMINVDFNKKDAIWIGGSTAFFDH